MKYKNPIITGMYPDPSICVVDGVYYLVNSSFEYFPGVPIFKSDDLISWNQIGNCLTGEKFRDMIKLCDCSGGIFAPTIRYYDGKFYVITSCMTGDGLKNFIVYSDNPSEKWSEPIFIDFEGIDPSLYFEDERVFVQYAGFGEIFQIEINLETGNILNGPFIITRGCGGRDTEGPHMWKRNGYYYLLLAEGGTREGHMVTLMRGTSIWGPFEPSPYNPVISNKDKPREQLQCIGHADWIVDKKGNDYLVALGTRPIKHKNILGRETLLTPAYWTEDGWLRSKYGYMPLEIELDINVEQSKNERFDLNMNLNKLPLNIISPRGSQEENCRFENNKLVIIGGENKLNDLNPTLLGIRQTEFNFNFNVNMDFVDVNEGDEIGVAMYITNEYHISLFLSKRGSNNVLVLRKNLLDVVSEISIDICECDNIDLIIKGNKQKYEFYYSTDVNDEVIVGDTYCKHLSIETASSPNTGVIAGVYVSGKCEANINRYSYNVLE